MDFSSKDSSEATPPPTDTRIKDTWFFLLEVIWLVFQIPVQIFLAVYRKYSQQPKTLKGQVAIVTGAGRGLGKGLALALVKEGCKVAVADVNLAGAEETAEEIRQSGGQAKAYFCNVAKFEEVRKLRTAISTNLGPVDLLVNNAGLVKFKSLLTQTHEEISEIISVNLLSHFWMVKEFLPSMVERNAGHVVAISSLASYAGSEDKSAYSASKFAVNGFMESVRAELSKIPNNKVKTTTVCPYYINTVPVDPWDVRIAAMTLDGAVKSIIDGIKKEEEMFTVPWIHHYLVHFMRLFPLSLFDVLHRSFALRNVPRAMREK